MEFALALPALVVVLGFALSAGAWAIELQGAQRAAGEAARAAITDTDAQAAMVGRAAGASAVAVSRSAGYVTACVTVTRAPWPQSTRCATARDRP